MDYIDENQKSINWRAPELFTEPPLVGLVCVYTKNELAELNEFLYFRYSLRNLALICLVLIAMVGVWLSYILVQYGDKVDRIFLDLSQMCMPLFAFLFALQAVRDWIGRVQNIEQMLDEDMPMQIIIGEAGWQVTTPSYSDFYQWRQFIGCIITDDHIIARLKQGNVIVPLRTLQATGRADYVFALIKSRMLKVEELTAVEQDCKV